MKSLFSVTLAMLCMLNRLSAQETSLNELPGTYRNAVASQALKTASGLDQLKGTDRINITHDLTVQHEALMQTPSLKSFTGMEARLYAYTDPSSAFQQRTTAEMRVMLYPFIKAFKTGKIVPADEAPATLSIFTNELRKILFNVDGWWDLTNRTQFPQFFDKFPIVDSTAGYMDIKANGQTFRILQLNNKPVFIPLTRKEFLQFLIAKTEKLRHESEKIVSDNRKQAKQNPKYAEIYEKNVTTWEKNAEGAKIKIQQYKNELAQLTPEQTATGAYINHNKAGDYYQQLAPAGRRDGTALYKVNPDYYDKSKSRSAAQLVIITYWYHHQFCPDWMQSYLKNLFDEIDYERLRKGMK